MFAEFLRDVVDADTHSLTLALAGTFASTEELDRAAEYAHELNMRLFDRTSAAGEIRPGLDVNDLSFIFEQLAAIRGGGEQRTRELRQRYLALLLDAIHNPAGVTAPSVAADLGRDQRALGSAALTHPERMARRSSGTSSR